MNKFNDELTNLLVDASVHHLHLTLETLPVGRIEVCKRGLIKTIDQWTECVLGYSAKDIIGKSLKEIVGDKALCLMESSNSKNFGKVGDIEFTTESGGIVSAVVVLIPALNPYRIVFELVYMKANGL